MTLTISRSDCVVICQADCYRLLVATNINALVCAENFQVLLATV